MRASHLLIPAGLLGALVIAGPAAERAAARSAGDSATTGRVSPWGALSDALDDAKAGRTRAQDLSRAHVSVDLSGSFDELMRLARELEHVRRRLDADLVEARLKDLGIDEDDLDIDLDDLADHLEELADAIADLAEFAAELDGAPLLTPPSPHPTLPRCHPSSSASPADPPRGNPRSSRPWWRHSAPIG